MCAWVGLSGRPRWRSGMAVRAGLLLRTLLLASKSWWWAVRLSMFPNDGMDWERLLAAVPLPRPLPPKPSHVPCPRWPSTHRYTLLPWLLCALSHRGGRIPTGPTHDAVGYVMRLPFLAYVRSGSACGIDALVHLCAPRACPQLACAARLAVGTGPCCAAGQQQHSWLPAER